MDLYEALYTTRAMRRVRPDPVPEDVVRHMLDSAIRAPSGGNTQQWRYVVVTDREVMAALGDLYRDAFDQLQATMYAGVADKARDQGDDQTLRVLSSSEWLAENFAQAPLVVMVFSRNDQTGSSTFPAVWNMMLAARGHGIGTTLTTILGFFKSAEVFELLGVPTDKGWQLNAAVTCGYPLGKWDVAARRPAHEVVFSDRWGEPPEWRVEEAMWDGSR